MNKYIFLAGAPGSRWSSVANVLYTSKDIDTSDNIKSYTMPGNDIPMHTGAYWDPGMEYGQNFNVLNTINPLIAEEEFNKPFLGDNNLMRVIKSHQFANHIEYLLHWKCPIVLVHRPNSTSYKWWLDAGGYGITHPSYEWYKDIMIQEIATQNKNIEQFVGQNVCESVQTASQLGEVLGLTGLKSFNFADNDTTVFVHIPK